MISKLVLHDSLIIVSLPAGILQPPPLGLAGTADHPAKKGTEVVGFNDRFTFDRLAYGVGTGKLHKMGVVGKDVMVLVSLELLSPK